MATVYVQEAANGQDYATLALAVAANETDIEIRGTWAAVEENNITIDDNNTTITCTGDSKHPGYVGGAPSHYRIEDDGGGHVFTISATPVTLDGLDILQGGNGASDECVRINTGNTVALKNCLLHSARAANDQDGIYCSTSCVLTAENCMIYNFDRAGLHPQSLGAGDTQTWNINSCSIWNCGEVGEAEGGGINANTNGASTLNLNLFNTYILDCSDGDEDYGENNTVGTHNWNIDYCIDSDNSIASRDGTAVGSLANRVIAQTDQGAGAYVIVEDTDSPYNLSLQDLGNAKNNAQDMHNSATGAGLNIPATDIVGTNRPQNTNYDCGAFEIVAAVGLSIPVAMHHYFRH